MRILPGIDALLERPALKRLEEELGAAHIRFAVRASVERAREVLKSAVNEGGQDSLEGAELQARSLVCDEEIGRYARALLDADLKPVVNGTGIILHTNLGRAPLGAAVTSAIARAAGATPLEIDLHTGRRGARAPGIATHLRALCGAEESLVTNNNAAAMLLALSALASDREVIVSRSELVEIGGGFRVPEVIERSGCRLVEVGTTNRTTLQDYQAKISARTGAILKVHRSNFEITGFTAEVSIADLARLSHQSEIPLVVDQGTGLLRASALGTELVEEPCVDDALEAGATLVCFSGDKLLGGPQAGIICGASEDIAPLARHPLMRALRCDKLTLAALAETLARHRASDFEAIPVHAFLRRSEPYLSEQATLLKRALSERGVASELSPCRDLVGGGSAPGRSLVGCALKLQTDRPAALSRALRVAPTPIIGVLRDESLFLHLRCIGVETYNEVADSVAFCVAAVLE